MKKVLSVLVVAALATSALAGPPPRYWGRNTGARSFWPTRPVVVERPVVVVHRAVPVYRSYYPPPAYRMYSSSACYPPPVVLREFVPVVRRETGFVPTLPPPPNTPVVDPYAWVRAKLPPEYSDLQIARVVRHDDGRGRIADIYGFVDGRPVKLDFDDGEFDEEEGWDGKLED